MEHQTSTDDQREIASNRRFIVNTKVLFFFASMVAALAVTTLAVDRAITSPQEATTKKAPAKKVPAKKGAAVSKKATGDVAKGKEIFKVQCATCHGAMGKGDGIAAAALKPKPRDLSDPKYMAGLKNDYIRMLLKKGGASVGKSPLMPALGAAMTDEQLTNVIAFVRSLSVEKKKADTKKSKKAKVKAKASG